MDSLPDAWIKQFQELLRSPPRSPQWWIALAALAVIFGAGVITIGSKCLEGLAAILENAKKLGISLRRTDEERIAIRRQQQFSQALASDLHTLNKGEQWNDQFFTDLEAEVETEGGYYASRWDQLRGHTSNALRRLPSLAQAIRTSTEKAILLVGDPGSGKSIALRHLAIQMAEAGKTSDDEGVPIPLYINLKELPPAPPGGPTVDFIKAFVIDNVRRGDADTADYIKQHWQKYRSAGTWFFLFDSFDEIPAIMHAPSGSPEIQRHAEALRQFLEGMSSCRGCVASREFKGPDSLSWPKFRILPLSERKQDELIDNSFLKPEQKERVRDHLALNRTRLQANPLLLTLLCRHVKQHDALPANDHDLLDRHLEALASREPEQTFKLCGEKPAGLLAGAMRLAILFAERPSLSLAPTLDELRAELAASKLTIERLDGLIDALVSTKIGRCDVPHASKGERRFTFSHRRYQEALFVRHLVENGERLRDDVFLLDARWREYLVALLQSQSTEVLQPILERAIALLQRFASGQPAEATARGFPPGLWYYTWDGPEVPFLSMLQEGLARRDGDVPDALRHQVKALLRPRWENGDDYDRWRVIQLAALLPKERLREYMREAVRTKNRDMQDVAFRMAGFLGSVSTELASWIRERIASSLLASEDRSVLHSMEALVSRLPSDVGARAVFNRVRRLKRQVRLASYLVFPAAIAVRELFEKSVLLVHKHAVFTQREETIPSSTELAISVHVVGSLSLFAVSLGARIDPQIGLVLVAISAASLLWSLSLMRDLWLRSEPGHVDFALVIARWRPLQTLGFALRLLLVFLGPGVILHVLARLAGYTTFQLSWYPIVFLCCVYTIAAVLGIQELLQRRRSNEHFRRQRNAGAAGLALAAHASSCAELHRWMREERDAFVKNLCETRSLLRVMRTPSTIPGPVQRVLDHAPIRDLLLADVVQSSRAN